MAIMVWAGALGSPVTRRNLLIRVLSSGNSKALEPTSPTVPAATENDHQKDYDEAVALPIVRQFMARPASTL